MPATQSVIDNPASSVMFSAVPSIISAAIGIACMFCLNACGPTPATSVTPSQPTTVTRHLNPTAWLAETLAKRDAPPREPDPSQPPVVLVHGIDGSARDMSRLARALRAAGRTVHTIDLVPNDGSAPLEVLSAQLDSFVVDHVPGDAPFDLAGYSMGGVVSRHYIQEQGGHVRVRRFVSISSPHHGTLIAWIRRGPGAMQMRIGSEFLNRLSHPDSIAKLPPTTSFLTTTDLIIIPFTSSTLPGARNIRLFGWGHFTGIMEPHAIRRIVAALAEP